MKSFISWCTGTYRSWVVESRRTRLMKLYEKKDYQSVANLFKNEKDYAEISVDQFPFPYYIISEGNKDALAAFLKKVEFKDYLRLDQSNPLKCNLLMFAYLENKQEIIDYLENQGFMIGAINSEGQNLLHLAAIYRRKDAFMSGLKKKLNYNLADSYGNTPLHYGCRSGELDIVEALLAGKAEKLANLIHLYPIHMAIQSNNLSVIEVLKDDLWLKYPMFHPIHSAARVGACEIMKRLLSKQPTLLNVKDYKSLTPLHHAVATESIDSLDFLLKQSEILVDLTDEFGNTPLHIAFMRDDIGKSIDILESAVKLINAKADLDKLNHDHLAPVDLGLDSSSLQMKTFLKSITDKSKRLREYGARF